ncbi:MAG: hypothetical protein BV458_12940 [Thermoplasmata archaeon M9B2D]|nr:MAG: hypothetical protein BV458_12940 [Thermoplasmata archaeon M9B2D]
MLRLNYPVYTLDKDVILPADTVISPEKLGSIISSKSSSPYKSYSLLNHGSVRQDILMSFQSTHFQTIFSDKDEVAEILSIMETLRLVLPVLETMDYFREKDSYTYQHFLRVFALSTLLAKQLLPDMRERISLVSAGPTHDVGKMCVPLEILKKKTSLTGIELSILENHAAAGYVLLSYYNNNIESIAGSVARDHHERRDKSGYPRGISLNDKITEIIAVSDIYDALVSSRPYRSDPYDNRTALEEITRLAEKGKLSWDIVKILVACHRKSKLHYTETTVSLEKRGTPPPNNFYGVLAEDDKDS